MTDEIGPGDHAAVLLVEHLWAARLREAVREAGGRLLGQGFLTPEVMMIVGAEIQARADAEAALELAQAARGAALVEALEGFAADRRRDRGSVEDRTRGVVEVVRILVDNGVPAPVRGGGRDRHARHRGPDRVRDGAGGDRRGGGPVVRRRLMARAVNAAELRDTCLGHPGAVEEFPFGPETSVFKVAGKIFALSALERDAACRSA